MFNDSRTNLEPVFERPEFTSRPTAFRPAPTKRFVSLSDILNNQKTPAASLPVTDKSNKHEIMQKIELARPGGGGVSSQSFSDLLTVQELFKELELDCDEQIKQLDEIELKRKSVFMKQKHILDEIKLKWQREPHLFQVRPAATNTKPKTQKTNKQHRKLISKSMLKPKNTLIISVRSNRVECFKLKRQVSGYTTIITGVFRPKKNAIKLADKYLFSTNKNSSIEFFYLNDQSNMKVCLQEFYAFQNSNLKARKKEIVTCSPANALDEEDEDGTCSKIKFKSLTSFDSISDEKNVDESNNEETQQSLLDRYYEKYCLGADTTRCEAVRQVPHRNEMSLISAPPPPPPLPDTTSEYSSASSTSPGVLRPVKHNERTNTVKANLSESHRKVSHFEITYFSIGNIMSILNLVIKLFRTF